MYTSALVTIILSATSVLGLAIPGSDMSLVDRGNRVVNPAAVTGTTCTARGTAIVDHDINVALLSICGGISGAIQQCGGSPASTTGASGTALFSLTASAGTIDISKGRWESCVAAARATCGDSPFTSTCIGGASGNSANVAFTLTKASALYSLTNKKPAHCLGLISDPP